MFRKIFGKDAALGDGDAKTILGRLGRLSSEERIANSEELKSLADTHSDPAVRVASVDVLTDFDSLSMLLSHSCAETAQSAAARIARDVSFRENLARSPKLLEIPHVQYSMLKYATSVEQAKTHSEPIRQIDGLNLVELCLDCVSDDVRQWLTSQISDLEQLQALEKASRNRNKNTNRLAREHIARLRNARGQLNNREEECGRLHATILAIIENELKDPTSVELQKTHLTYARLNTISKGNLALKSGNHAALQLTTTGTDKSDLTRLTRLQDQIELTDNLLEQAAHMLDARITEQKRQEQIQKEQTQKESASSREEVQNIADNNFIDRSVKSSKPQENGPAQNLQTNMQKQDSRNASARKQLETSSPGVDIYQNLWRALSTSLKLSKQAHSINRNLKKQSIDDNAEVLMQISQLSTNIDSFIEYGNEVKEAVTAQFTRSLKKLDDLLSDGNMTSAVGLHADCKNKSRMLPDHTSKSLLVQFNGIDKRYSELNDWRSFAATPKQVELCEAVEKLADNALEPLEPEAQVEHLKMLRKRWQDLGRANRTLNKRFDDAASRAFAPCQAYFDELNRIRKDNLDKRNAVLGQLRTYVEKNDWASSDIPGWKLTEKILRTARSEWNSYVPIDRRKIRTAQKSFDQVCDQIHQKLNGEWKKNLDQKQAYLDRARELASAEGSLTEIIDDAKSLQVSWREVGITPRGPDQRLWREFRKLSNKIFARRDEEKKHIREQRIQLNTELLAEYKTLSSSVEQYEKELSDKGTTVPDIKPLHSAHRALMTKMSEVPGNMADNTGKLGEKLKQLEKLTSTRLLEHKLDTLKELDMQIIDLENNIISGTIDKLEDLHNIWQELAARFSTRLPEKQFLKLEDACKQRISSLFSHCTGTDSGTLQKLFDTSLLAQTETVVRAEIEAGMHSGKSDEQLRMQMQVERLKSGLANRQVQTLNPEHMALDWCGTHSCGLDRQALSSRYFLALTALV